MKIRLTKEQLRKLQDSTGDIDEQEITTSPEAGGEDVESTTAAGEHKWESGVERGKANPIGTEDPWESGVERGKANPIW